MSVEWTTACPDWGQRIREGRSLIPFAPLFPAEAEAAMQIFDDLVLVDAPGSPRLAEAGRPWVHDFARAIFGAYEHETGRRLIREFFLLISKKNSKSTTAGGIMLTALMRNWRMSAEFLIVAPTLEVANNSFFPARDMVKADPELAEILHVQEHLKQITHRATGATLKVVAADNDTVSGKKATAVLIDELWLFGKRANAENMLREAVGGLIARPEGFIAYLSTQSDEPPAGVFKSKLSYFRDVRDGKIEDRRSLPVLYEFPPEMEAAKEYLDPKNFYVTNPNLGASVDEEFLRDELKKAQNAGEESLRGFLAKHLNVEIGMALRGDRWIGADFWEDAVDSELTLEKILQRCESVTIGIDGGGMDDLLSLYVIGRENQPGQDVYLRRWLGWGHSWAFSDPKGGRGVLQRRQSEASRLKDFERDGDLTIFTTPNDEIHGVVGIIRRVYEAGVLAGVGADPAGKAIAAIADALEMSGMVAPDGTPFRMTQVSQGWHLQASIGVCERELANGRLIPAAQPILAWAVSNMKTEPRGNAEIITKAASGKAKIDPGMAMFDAAFLMSKNPDAAPIPQISVW